MKEKVNPGLVAALSTPLFLGMNPIFGKLAYQNGADPFTVAALRTLIAVVLLWVVYYLFWRQYLYIYPIGFINCIAVGFVNGVGSIFYYNGLHLLDASVAQLLNGTYLVFVIILTRIHGGRIGVKTAVRVLLALIGLALITGGIGGHATWFGVGLMLGNALLFGGTIVMSQRALYDMPAQTVTFYVLAAMAVVVCMVRVAYDLPIFVKGEGGTNFYAMWAIFGLAVTTALSRLLMFISVRGLGTIRTSLLAFLEIITSLVLGYIFLGDRFTTIQWFGVITMLVSLLLPTDIKPADVSPTAYWPDFTRLQLWQVAFSKAFTEDKDKVTSQEIRAIQQLFHQEKYTTQEMRTIEALLMDFDEE